MTKTSKLINKRRSCFCAYTQYCERPWTGKFDSRREDKLGKMAN